MRWSVKVTSVKEWAVSCSIWDLKNQITAQLASQSKDVLGSGCVCVRVCACLTVRVWYKRTVQYSQVFVAFCPCVCLWVKEGLREADSLTLCCSVPVHANENLLTCQSLLTKDNPLTVCSTSCYPSSTFSSSLPFFKSSASNFPPCLSLSLWSPPPFTFCLCLPLSTFELFYPLPSLPCCQWPQTPKSVHFNSQMWILLFAADLVL